MAVSPITLAKAKAIQIGIRNMIGEEPALSVYDTFAEIDFTEEQARKFREYLDSHVRKLFRDRAVTPPELQIRFGKVLIPWGVSYLLPVLVASFAAGFMSNTIIFGRR